MELEEGMAESNIKHFNIVHNIPLHCKVSYFTCYVPDGILDPSQ